MKRLWAIAWLGTACGLDPSTDTPTDEPIRGACNRRAPGQCGNACEPIVARRLEFTDDLQYCLDDAVPLEEVGCRIPELDCGLALAFAIDENGAPWWFPDRCLPDGFELSDKNLPDCN